MPISTYQCQACGRTFERVQPITEAPLERTGQTCCGRSQRCDRPECGSRP